MAPKSNAIVAGLAFAALFVGSISLVLLINLKDDAVRIPGASIAWWKKTLIYHVYVPSFMDSDGDGYGDLKGLTSKLEYIDNLGFDSIWLSPIYEFGGVDMGNDVTNHSKISPLFGTEQDFDDFLAAAATFNMKVIIEFIPNHTSKKHEWFIKSEAGVEQYRDYYTWSNETNDWKSVTNNSVWSYSDKRGEYYLHNYLPEMPELNLDNPSVRQELLDILKYYLEKPSIMGIHIGAFNILFESSLSNTLIVSDVKKTMDFLHEINNLTEKYSAVDGLERLILLEMLDNEFVEVYRDIFHNKSSGIAVVPFSFGSIPIEYGFSGELTGNRIHNEIIEYYDESPNEDSWPCWEMHDHEMVKGLGRFPININNILFMLTLLLPGTSVMYYGDEIGMSNSSRIAYEEMKDPYTLKYCTPANYSECISRDHSRTPMQWTAGKNGGFTNASKPWLPLNDDYKVHNVEVQQNSYLDMFRNITKLRQMEAFKTGKVYFPFFDEDIFSFLRKAEGEKHAYMVVVYINGIVNVDTERKPQKMKRRLRNHVHDKTLDFTRIMPDFPETGTVIAMTDLASEDSTHYVGEILQMSKLGINKFEGFVIELDFEHKSYEEEGEH